MEAVTKPVLTAAIAVQAPLEKVWEAFTHPKHITNWYFASDDWHAPSAENNLQKGGDFKITMAARDGSFQFDFGGVYDKVVPHKELAFTVGDGRKVTVLFEEQEKVVTLTETFEAENVHPLDFQQKGWQAILDNFKKYTENLSS